MSLSCITQAGLQPFRLEWQGKRVFQFKGEGIPQDSTTMQGWLSGCQGDRGLGDRLLNLSVI
jgi:hypothetical protein